MFCKANTKSNKGVIKKRNETAGDKKNRRDRERQTETAAKSRRANAALGVSTFTALYFKVQK